jgi:hypothetical protein
MTVKQLIEDLQNLVKEKPEVADYVIVDYNIYKDQFEEKTLYPSLGGFYSDHFLDESEFYEWLEDCGDKDLKLNAITLN